MTLDGLTLRDATEADLPVLAGMRRDVGWDAPDWALLAAIESAAGRFVVVVDGEDLVASGSGMVYGALGCVGNMIVTDRYRRRGIGSWVLTEVVDHLRGAGCRRIELYATPDGRRLYRRHDFESVGTSAFAQVPSRLIATAGASTIGPASGEDLEALAAYDTPRFGGDRRELLIRMLSDTERPVRIARRAGRIVGWSWLRIDGRRVGPLVADEPAVAADLLADAAAAMPEASALRLHLPPANRAGAEWLRGLGVPLESWDGRMALGDAIARRDDAIYASTTGALG